MIRTSVRGEKGKLMSHYNANILFDEARMQYLFIDGDKTYAVSREFLTQYPRAAGKLLAKMMKKGRGENDDVDR